MLRSLVGPGIALLMAVSVLGVACAPAAAPAPTKPAAAPKEAAQPSPKVQAKAPTRAVEFVISTAPGGGSDIYARFWIGVMEKAKLTPVPVQPVNKEGGAGAVAFQYVFEKRGDPHYIMVTLNSFFTTLITQKLPFKSTDFTPIANLGLDPFYLWVNEESPWKTARDFLAAAREREVTVAGTGAKQEDEILFRRIEQLAGTKPFKYVPQQGGGQVAAALAGGQVEATVNNPSEGLGFYQASPRKLRPLCAFAPESPKEGPYMGLPTCKQQGLDISDYYIMRAVMGTPGLAPEYQAFWADVFKQVFESADWKDFMVKNNLEPKFMAGEELVKFVNDYEKLHRDIANKFGWVQ